MNGDTVNRINNFSTIFRLITPALIAIIGTLLVTGQNDVKIKLTKMDNHFTNHLLHHQDLEVGYERRLTSIEETRFTAKDSIQLENKIMKQLPPMWLKDKIKGIEEKLDKRR